MQQMRDGSVAQDGRLGRLEHFDLDSRNYTAREYIDAVRQLGLPKRRGRAHRPGPTLDQRNVGQCVSEMCHHARNGAPVMQKPVRTGWAERQDFYFACQRRDPWEGGEYPGASPRMAGTSVLAGMQEGKDRHWWPEYRWIGAGSGRVEDDVIDTLRDVSGIGAGTVWLRSMMETRPSGLLEVDWSSGDVGGHAYWITGLALHFRLFGEWRGTKAVVRVQQSWGDDWGIGWYQRPGTAIMLLDSFLELLERNGEGAVPLEVPLSKLTAS